MALVDLPSRCPGVTLRASHFGSPHCAGGGIPPRLQNSLPGPTWARTGRSQRVDANQPVVIGSGNFGLYPPRNRPAGAPRHAVRALVRAAGRRRMETGEDVSYRTSASARCHGDGWRLAETAEYAYAPTYKAEVAGSIPAPPTNQNAGLLTAPRFVFSSSA